METCMFGKSGIGTFSLIEPGESLGSRPNRGTEADSREQNHEMIVRSRPQGVHAGVIEGPIRNPGAHRDYIGLVIENDD
jgi:hypothetical protein